VAVAVVAIGAVGEAASATAMVVNAASGSVAMAAVEKEAVAEAASGTAVVRE